MIFKHKRKRSRSQLLSDLAPRLGMKFSQKDELQLLKLLLDFKLFRKGGAKKIKNLHWTNHADLKSRIFDYQYTVSTGNSSQTFRQTVFFFYSKHLGLPQFRLQPEKIIHRIGAWLGFEDIDFVAHEKFSKKFHLTGEDEQMVRHTFPDSVLQYFTFHDGWSVEGLNYFLIIYKKHKRLPPIEIRRHYKSAKEIYQLLLDEGFNV